MSCGRIDRACEGCECDGTIERIECCDTAAGATPDDPVPDPSVPFDWWFPREDGPPGQGGMDLSGELSEFTGPFASTDGSGPPSGPQGLGGSLGGGEGPTGPSDPHDGPTLDPDGGIGGGSCGGAGRKKEPCFFGSGLMAGYPYQPFGVAQGAGD